MPPTKTPYAGTVVSMRHLGRGRAEVQVALLSSVFAAVQEELGQNVEPMRARQLLSDAIYRSGLDLTEAEIDAFVDELCDVKSTALQELCKLAADPAHMLRERQMAERDITISDHLASIVDGCRGVGSFTISSHRIPGGFHHVIAIEPWSIKVAQRIRSKSCPIQVTVIPMGEEAAPGPCRTRF